jgi:hypothetical protein
MTQLMGCPASSGRTALFRGCSKRIHGRACSRPISGDLQDGSGASARLVKQRGRHEPAISRRDAPEILISSTLIS